MTREDIMRAGRAGDPWGFVPLGVAALRVAPQDVEIRFLLSAAYASVGLRTAAIEHLDRLPAGVQEDGALIALRRAIQTLPNDRIPLDDLERTAIGNLHALRDRASNALDLVERIGAWRAGAERCDWFRTSGGEALSRARAGDDAWACFEPHRAMAAALKLQHDERPSAEAYAPPYFIEGMDPPWVFLRLSEGTPTRADGHAPLLVLAQSDPVQFIRGLAQHDLRAHLSRARLRVFVGEHAGRGAADLIELRSRAGLRAAGPVVVLPTCEQGIRPGLQESVLRAVEIARADNAAASSAVHQLYPARSRTDWAARFAAARGPQSEDPLRVLIPTSRYTTFLRHSAADLAAALERAGCVVRLHVEPDDHALHDGLADLRAVADARPDLVIVPNYLRANLASYPREVPYVAWIQDAMPHLFEPNAGAACGELDFVIGHTREDMFHTLGYPRSRTLPAPMAASERKFHPGPVGADAAARHACEIAYVSHHSQTAEALHQTRRSQGAASPGVPELLDALLPRVLRLVDEPPARTLFAGRLLEITRAEMVRLGGSPNDAAISHILNAYTHPIADRALRHRVLRMAAAIAARRGWRMRLYGKGWETHPTLATHARAELAHGEDLRACYQTARVHLHMSLHTAIHQRVFECAMSGGLPLCLLHADDLSQLEYLAGAAACRTREPDAIDPTRRSADGYAFGGYRLEHTAEGERYAALLRGVGLPVPEHAWLNQIHAERLQSSPQQRIDGEGESICDLWPDPAAVMFHDEATLERALERAIGDDGWRSEQSWALGDRARERVSYDALARSMLAFVEDRLRTGGENEPRRWYDGRGSATTRTTP